MTFYVGAYLPDGTSSDSIFSQSVQKIAIDLDETKKNRVNIGFPIIDLYFLLPGKNESPHFKSMRLHPFDPPNETLRLDSVVPPGMINSDHATAFIIAAMQDAIDNASEYFEQENINFDGDVHKQLIQEIARKNNINISSQ